MLHSELVLSQMAFQEAWACAHYGAIQQEEEWEEEWECLSALPCQHQETGVCRVPLAAQLDSPAWVALVQCQDP